MESQSVLAPARPQSIKELVAQAENFTFNANIPMRYWTRAADTLYQEASFALSDGDYGRAYMMLYRHSVLVLKFLPTHPQFKDPESRKLFKPLSKRVDRVIEDLEQIKPEIERVYNEWERMAAPPPTAGSRKYKSTPSAYADFAARDPSLSGNARVLDASEHQELAVDLAQEELSRRARDKRAHRHAGIWQDRISIPPSLRVPQSRPDVSSSIDDVDLRNQMELTRRTLDRAHETRAEDTWSGDQDGAYKPAAQHYYYPSLSKSRPVDYDHSHRSASTAQQPLRPPKELLDPFPSRNTDLPHQKTPTFAPLVPRKVYPESQQQPEIPRPPINNDQPPRPPKGEIENSLPKKERLAFKPGGYLENGDPIRSIFLPSKLKRMFLDIASKNTAAGLETCGILCGTPINNALFVRCLLVPDQKSTPDTCETENESAVFDYCMGEDLLMLGWIHTHPTQTCFMSSRDLHTHAGYQVMMAESIAIVCAPKFNPSYGIFRLTHPPGLDHVLNCSRTETFHQHSIDNLYREADHPHGHVYESDKMPLQVVDLRTK